MKGDKVFNLADRVAQSLASPHKYHWAHHPDVLDMHDFLLQHGVDSPALKHYWAEFAKASRWTLQMLNQATKFRLKSDFVDIVDRWYDLRPPMIEQLLMTARLPAVPMWIEWEGPNAGILITQYRQAANARLVFGTSGWYEAQFFNIGPGGSYPAAQPDLNWAEGKRELVYPFPMSLIFSPDSELTNEFFEKGRALAEADETFTYPLRYPAADLQRAHKNNVLGRVYCEKWRKFTPLLDEIARHGMWIHSEPGFFPSEFFRIGGETHGFGAEFKTRQEEHLLSTVHNGTALLRKVIATLALIATHIGGGTAIRSNKVTAPRQFLKGKFLPTYEYKVLSLTRPMGAPTLFRRTIAAHARSAEGVRWHEVQGAWHHRRAITSVCQMHPRACPQAIWSPILDDDGNKLGADQQQCELCDRKRWRIEQHGRGDRRLGVVEKDYEVRAPRRPPPAPREAA